MMPDAAMLAGMERSTKPPLVVTNSMPSAAKPVKATDWPMLSRFWLDRKRSERSEPTRSRAMKTKKMA